MNQPAVAIRALVERGEFLRAYDESTTALETAPDDLELQFLAVLALVRSGAEDAALRFLDRSDLERSSAVGTSADLIEDAAALRARISKGRALAVAGDDRRALAAVAAADYEAVFDRMRRPYSCINAATMWLVAGDEARARALAAEALALVRSAAPGSDHDAYWSAVTEAEALLLVDRPVEAGDAIERAAGHATGDHAARAATRRQLRLVCGERGIDTSLLEPLRAPSVIHFTGHRVAPTGSRGRFPATAERGVADRVDQALADRAVGFGYGSLAAGADIVVAERLLDRGAELHVVLPFAIDEFLSISVDPSGADWRARFERCCEAAHSITFATDEAHLDDDILFAHCAQLAMGDAIIRAAFLDTEVAQLAAWDGEATAEVAGTAVDVDAWTRSGRASIIIDTESDHVDDVPPSRPTAGRRGRVVRSMLFADVAGYSRLTDAEVPAFVEHVIGPLAETIDRFEEHLRYRNTWGDAIYTVFDAASHAAACALALQETMSDLDLGAVGLRADLALRIGAHAGPVYELVDPIRREPNFYGTGVTRAARIEPGTPVGEIYVTHPFAALSALDGDRSFSCQYVGRLPTAKGYGTFPMYVLKRVAGDR